MALYQTIQDFPAGVCVSSCQLTAKNRAGVVEVTEHSQDVQLLRGQGWAIELGFLPMEREEAAVLEAFLLSLRAGSGRFWMGDPYQSLPLGVASGSPVTSGAAAGDEVLSITGFAVSVIGQLKANDKVQIGSHLYAVLSDVDSDGAGSASVRLWPPLREAYANGTAIITQNARGVFALTETTEFTRDVLELHGTQLIAAEVRL